MNEEMKDVLHRIATLEDEVQLLKQQLAKSKVEIPIQMNTDKKEATPPPSRPVITPPTVAIEKLEQEKPIVSSLQKQPKDELDFEKQLGIWLPRVFMFILLLGVLWGLKVGMDYGVITDPVRIGLGYAGTGLLYFLGMRYMESGKNGYGLTLLGGFIALGILTTFAAHHLYGYLSFVMALLVGIVYIGTGLWLSMRTKSETLTIFSAIAGFLLPFLLEGQGATAIQFCLYMLLLFMSLFYVSLSQKHKYTFYITFLLFHLTLLVYILLEGINNSESIIVGTIILQHLSLLFFYLKGTISRQVFTEALIYSNFVFAIGWVQLLDSTERIVVYGAFALLYVALAAYYFTKKDVLLRGVLSAVAVFAISVFVLSFDFENYQFKLMLLLVNGAIGMWVGLRYDTLRTIFTSAFIYLLTFQTILVMDFTELQSMEHVTWILLLATMIWIFYSLYQYPAAHFKGENSRKLDKLLIIGQLVSMIYLYNVVGIATTYFLFTKETGWHILMAVMIVTLCLMYLFNKWEHGQYLTHAVVIEYLLLGIMSFGFGIGGYYNDQGFIFNLFVEIIYVVILFLLFVSFIRNRFYMTQQQLKLDVAGLAVVMQITSFIYLNKWYFAIVNVNNWSWEYVLLFHTFLLFAFAFLSISIGRRMLWKKVKVIGVALIGVCILKLFFVDLANISILFRAVLFTVVGIVGLIYSRTLLKD